MKCNVSLENFAVLQRTPANGTYHTVSGTCRAAGRLLLSAETGGKLLPKWRDRPVGAADKGHFLGVIDGLPTGGPYTLTFTIVNDSGRVLERTAVHDILVGDLWIMAGQSNMQGYGYMPPQVPENPLIHNFYMDNRWGIAREPLHNLDRAAAPVHGGDPTATVRKNPPRGVGPGLAFAAEMLRFSGVPQGLIACAHGGTSMAQWDPALKKKGDFSFYGATINRVRHLGGRVAGILWYQGCNDTTTSEAVCNYTARMKKLFAAFRRDCRDPRLPIVFAQLSHNANIFNPANWTAVRCQQLELLQKVPRLGLAVTIDLELDDYIHLSNAGQKICGERMAYAMRRLLGDNTAPSVPMPERCIMKIDPISDHVDYIVTFTGVNGALHAAGRPNGFSLLGPDGEARMRCFRTEVEGNQVHVHLDFSCFNALATPPLLSYGAGCEPYCNIADDAGMPLPAFRISPRKTDCRLTKMVTLAEVSDPIKGCENVKALALPDDPVGLRFVPAACPEEFYLAHPQRGTFPAQEEKIFYYRFRVWVPETMELKIMTGSDGPFVFYWDGHELMRHHTANPIIPDEFSCRITAEAGRHECMVAQGSNLGNAWGFCCRLKRTGRGPLPEFV